MRGRVMEGYVFVAEEGTASEDDLRSWLGLAQAFVATLPAKPEGEKRRKPRSPRE